MEVDNIFKIYRIPHEPFFSYLITHEVESFVDAYDDFTMYDDELDDAIEHLSRELFYILFRIGCFCIDLIRIWQTQIQRLENGAIYLNG